MNDTAIGLTAFAVIAASFFLWIRGIRRVEIPEDRRFFVAAWIVGAGLAIAALQGDANLLARILSWFALTAAGVLLLTVSISRQKVGEGAISVGDTIPEFTAIDEHGETFDSQSLAGSLVLIKFFRAHW